MRREFGLTHTVRYDEADCNTYLTPVAFLRYMQELASRDAESVQLPGNGIWVVKRTHISFAAPVKAHTQIDLKTFGIGFSRITALRGYEARLAGETANEAIVTARTLWVYLDARGGRPARLPEGTAEIWLPDDPTRQPEPEDALPLFPDVEPHTISSKVRFSDIDRMNHLNNAAAVGKLEDAAWEAYSQYDLTPNNTVFEAQSYDIEYLDSPVFGEELHIQTVLEPAPQAGQAFTRVQRMLRGGKTVVRARSKWHWR